MQKDNLGICPRCGSDACYENNLGADYKVYQCVMGVVLLLIH